MTRKALAALLLISACFAAAPAEAYWIWSPDIGKWINPKKSAKDTPEEQYDWAMSFYNERNWDRAIEEFEKLPAVFPNSRLAAEGSYFSGLCWKEKNDLAKSADNFQKVIDKYPYSDRIKDAIKQEFEIANDFANGERMKVLGLPVLSGQEKALELYNHIVKNAPFGSYGDQAQFKIGELYTKQGEYELAQKAFQQLIDDYPTSELATSAKYQIAQTSLIASKRSHYHEQNAQKAIDQFEEFKTEYPSSSQSVQAEEAIRALRAKKAQNAFETAEFYSKQNKASSAKVYYRETLDRYPETSFAVEAKKRLEALGREESAKAAAPSGKKFFFF